MEFLLQEAARWMPLIVPCLAVASLVISRVAETPAIVRLAEASYYVAFLAVAALTLHTVASNHSTWLLHTASLGLLVVGTLVRIPTELPEAA